MDKGKTPEKEIQAKQNQMLKEGKAYVICHENDSIEKKEQALQDRSIMSVIELGASSKSTYNMGESVGIAMRLQSNFLIKNSRKHRAL